MMTTDSQSMLYALLNNDDNTLNDIKVDRNSIPQLQPDLSSQSPVSKPIFTQFEYPRHYQEIRSSSSDLQSQPINDNLETVNMQDSRFINEINSNKSFQQYISLFPNILGLSDEQDIQPYTLQNPNGEICISPTEIQCIGSSPSPTNCTEERPKESVLLSDTVLQNQNPRKEKIETARHLCPYVGCNKHFSSIAHARRHIRIHKKLPPFRCPFQDCHASFSRRDNCKQHQKHRHG